MSQHHNDNIWALLLVGCLSGALVVGCSDGDDTSIDGSVADDSSLPEGATTCGEATLLSVPSNPGQAGPWPVGNVTLTRPDGIGDVNRVDVWYPAEVGSDAGGVKKTYDFAAEWAPESERDKLPEGENALAECDCIEGLPIDTEHGPYPVIVYIHGTAAFRTTSLGMMTHLASRGFIVVAADHLGMYMPDWLSGDDPDDECVGELPATNSDYTRFGDEAGNLIDAVAAATGEWSFIEGTADGSRAGATGHSAGGVATAFGVTHPSVQVLVPMQGWMPVLAAPNVTSVLGIAATRDEVASWDLIGPFYDSWTAPTRRVVAVKDAGHLLVTELCDFKNPAGNTILDVGVEYGICGTESIANLFDCADDHIPVTKQVEIVRYASTAAFEEVLYCRDHTESWAAIGERYPEIEIFKEDIE